MAHVDRRWYRLDNAAKLFPALMGPRTSTVFSVGCVFNETVDAQTLKDVVKRVLPAVMARFPSFSVRLRDGLFWTFLEENKAGLRVQQPVADPCRPTWYRDDRGFLLRVLLDGQKLSVEASHALTDGTGLLVFFKTLLVAVGRDLGLAIDDAAAEAFGALALEAVPDPAEAEDAYAKHFDKDVPPASRLEKAWRLKERLAAPNRYATVQAIVPVQAIKEQAKQHGVGLTTYLVALHLMALQDAQNEAAALGHRKRPLRVMVPVNLRQHLPSPTLHNFFLPVFPAIDPRLGAYTFEETLHAVHHDLSRMNLPKWISRQIARNVTSTQHPLVRMVPNAIKRRVTPWVYASFGSKQHSGVLSNLGLVSPPPALAEAIASFVFIPNPNPATVTNLGVVAYNGSMVLTFGSLSEDARLPKLFLQRLRAAGVPVSVAVDAASQKRSQQTQAGWTQRPFSEDVLHGKLQAVAALMPDAMAKDPTNTASQPEGGR